MNEENHMGWKLVSGVRRDVINLFKSFANTNSVRFEDFAKVWRETMFSLIFSNRTSLVELLEFSEEILQIVKEYLFSVYEFHTRVAALYVLYGLYFKQPILGAAKIRFTQTEWEEVYSLVEKAKEGKHYDIAFIFVKLYVSGAFSFTATIRPAGLERGFRKYSEKRSSLHSKVCDTELLYRPLISPKLVDSLVKLESLYCRKKSELLGKRNLVFINGKFAESLKEDLRNYETACQNQYNPKNKISASQVESTSVTDTVTETKMTVVPSSSKSKNSQRPMKHGEVEKKDLTNRNLRKFNKKYLEILARKKAEFYIRKLRGENNVESIKMEPYPGLGEISDSEDI